MAETVADLLTVMGALNNELRISPGGASEARAIVALTLAQHYFETVAASLPGVLQSTITVGQVANQETSPWASTLLRLDAIWMLDDATGIPSYPLDKIWDVGGHVPVMPWPLQLSVTPGTGAARAYYANENNFYWLPRPDAVHTARIYGFVEQAEFVNRASAYNYPKRCKLAIANFANKIISLAIGDDEQDLDAMAAAIFTPLLRGLRKFDRSTPMPRLYRDVHYT